MEELWKSWGELIRLRRTAKKLSTRKLALRAGISQSAIVHIEHGRFSPTDETRIAIADALDFKVERLFPYPSRRQVKKGEESDEPTVHA